MSIGVGQGDLDALLSRVVGPAATTSTIAHGACVVGSLRHETLRTRNFPLFSNSRKQNEIDSNQNHYFFTVLLQISSAT